ncbi:MAG: methyl-accepting chemotaxis protein [Mariprofundaceae bacterium]|nr:methyl-accepting chemotaxis protein [Mariprofundaceae bacterium]
MRNNQPVTQTEHKMKPDDILVSRTDLKGRILYANKAFCDIAGYSVDELKGKAHNVVRHPDMPEAAFQDLWDTLSADMPWTGLVKNRCANGDYYWVVANVSPEYDKQGEVCGYLSVRSTPTQEQIDSVEELYRDVNAGKTTLPSTVKASWLKRLKLRTVMLASTVVSIVGLCVLGGFFGMSLYQEKQDADLRVEGVPLIASVRQVLEVLPQHRGLGNAWLHGNKNNAEKLTSLEQKIDTAMRALVSRAGQSSIQSLKSNTEDIQRGWSALKHNWKNKSAEQSFAQHSNLIKQLIVLSGNIYHQSRIVSDSSLDVIHLGEYIAEGIPDLSEYLGRIRGLGAGIAAAGSISSVQRDKMIKLSVQAEAVRGTLVEETAHVIEAYNPKLESALSPPISKLKAATDVFFQQVNEQLLHAQTIKLDSQKFFNQGSTAIAASLDLFDTMDASLSGLLAKEQHDISRMFYLSMGLAAVGVLLSLLLGLLMIHKTFRPLREIVQGMQRIVEGDYTQMPSKHAHDELGDIVDDMKTMQSILQFEIFEGKAMAQQREEDQKQAAAEKAQAEAQLADAFESNVGSLIEALATEVQQVSGSARDMDTISHSLAAQSENALHSVENGGAHVNSTAAAIEQMSMSISEVSRQVSDTQQKSAQAVDEAESATEMMARLTRVADEVGSIVGAISDIAEQTNLLALNASIEAARAGEAGRGFSVVAGEVKELASQTSQATEQIRRQVEGIQSESRDVNKAIAKISETISEINAFTSAVAEAMDQQSLASREISQAAQQADVSMGEARTSVGDVATSAGNVDKSSDEMINVAGSMAQRTEDVQDGIRQFVNTLRKAA